MAGTSNYPGALDNFSAASPTNLGDDDSTGRNHGERHDDLEAAVEAVQGELGINPAGTATTVVARLDGLDSSKAPVANPTFSGVAAFPDGSESAPSVTNDGDTNTGLFFPAADTVAVTTGGTERVRVDSSGRLLAGLSSAQTIAVSGKLQVSGTGADAYVVQSRFANNAANPGLILGKSRGTSFASRTSVNSGDNLGEIGFYGDDGSTWVSSARIQAAVDGTPSAGEVPGRVTFAVKPAGVALTERMRIDSNGLITGTGTSLGAWTAYTPTLGGTGWAIGNGTATGAYCQIGKIVFFRGQVLFGSTSTFGAGVLTIDLPVTARNNTQNQIHARLRDVSAGVNVLGTCRAFTTTTVGVVYNNATPAETGVTTNAPFTWADGDFIYFSGSFEAA